jgi:hypothetical protein
MSNVYFVNEKASARVELALCLKRIVECTASFINSEEHSFLRKELALDVIAANNISFGIVAYGTITEEELMWIIERHDANELWTVEEFAAREDNLLKLVKGE